MQNDRENLVYLAKLAEQAERFDEMATTGVERGSGDDNFGVFRTEGRGDRGA